MNPPCGTRRGYKRHRYHNETPCDPCTQANREYDRQRPSRRPKERPMNAQETAAEIEHLLWLRQGQAYILARLGNPSTDTLKRKLARAGRHDLIPRLYQMDVAA